MRAPFSTVVAALVLTVLSGCTQERVCSAVGWSNTVVVQLGPDWPDLTDASVRVASGQPVPLTGRSAEVRLDMSLPDTVVVTLLDAQGAELAESDADLDWRRVGGTEECGGPAEAAVVIP